MTRTRASLYSILFVLALGSAVVGRRYLDSLNVHEYARRHRAAVPEIIRLEEAEFRHDLEAAIDVRLEPVEGQPTLENRHLDVGELEQTIEWVDRAGS